MKKIDLHIHTIKTVSDSIKGDEFEYSFDKLKEGLTDTLVTC